MSTRGSQLEAGAVIGGYRIDGLISRGGMGMVYRATNLALNRRYALKVIAPELADDEQFRERFKREIRVAAALDHPNVVAIRYAGEHEGMLFLAMDFVDGTDLREVIARDGALAPERAVAILVQVTSALDAAHHEGLVHRDVKPANILISVKDGSEHAYLTDFGLAKRFDNATAVTLKGGVVGTVDYMPPEQITGDATDARTDIYALGCVFYQMLTGKIPYDRDNSVATLFAHVHDSPPSLVGSAAATDPTLGPVVARAMAKSPADRYLSAGDFARDAVAALEGSRYTGPPTIVATGEARLEGALTDEQTAERARIALESMKAAMTQIPAQETELQSGPAPEPPEQSPKPPEREPKPPAQEPTRLEQPPTPPAQQSTPPEQQPTRPAAPAPEPTPEPALAAEPEPTPEPARTAAPTPETTAPPPPPAAAPPAAAPPAAAPPAPAPPAAAPPAPPAAAPPPPAAAPSRKPRWPILAGLAVLVIAAIVIVVVVSGGSSGQPFSSALGPVPTNRVTGSGQATVTLAGDVATVTVTAHGLIAAPHLMHIHAGGQGLCPPASAARLHNGHLSISTSNAARFYGKPVVSLTTVGDTSPRSIIDFTRYPVGATINYKRTISLPASVVTEIRDNNAVVIVHGIDYSGTGSYDDYLGASDLNNRLTEESTDPALCGPLVPATSASASVGSHGPLVYTASLTANKVLSAPGAMSDMAMGPARKPRTAHRAAMRMPMSN